MSINDPIACLLKKMKDGEMPQKTGERILRRLEALKGHYGDAQKASEIAVKMLDNEMNALALRSANEMRAVKRMETGLSEVTDSGEAKNFVQRMAQTDIANIKTGHFTEFFSPIAAALNNTFKGRSFIKGISEADSLAMVDFLAAGKPLKGHLKDIAEGIEKSMQIMHRTANNFGAFGFAKLPKGFIPLDVQPGRIIREAAKSSPAKAADSFAVDMGKFADLDFLVENTPFFHRIEGGIGEYLRLGFKVYNEGAAVTRKSIEKLGITPGEFKDIFAKSLKAADANGWKEFNMKYGRGHNDLVASIHSYGNRLAEYTAKLDAFGHSPVKYGERLEAALSTKSFELGNTFKKALNDLKFIEHGSESHIYTNRSIFGGKSFGVGNWKFQIKPEKFIGTLQQMNPYLIVRGAFIMAASTDAQYSAMLARNWGMKTSTRLNTFLKSGEFGELLHTNRELAIRTASSIDYYSNGYLNVVRGLDTGLGTEAMDKSADWTLRVVGLSPLTELHQQLNTQNIMYNLADNVLSKWSNLEPRLRADFARYGIGEEAWEIMKKHAITTEEGGKMMSPGAIIDSHPEISLNFASFMAFAKEMGTPVGSPKTKQFIEKASAAGISNGIAARMITTFQGFNASVYTNWILQAGAGKGRMGIYAELVARTTVAGMFATVLYNAAKGETTNFKDPDLILEGLLRGGPLSFYGDGLASLLDVGGYSKKLRSVVGDRVTGTSVGTILDVIDAFKGNAKKALEDKDTKLASDLFEIANKYNILDKNWLFGQFWEKAITDNIRAILDPVGAARKKRKKAIKLAKEGRSKIFNP